MIEEIKYPAFVDKISVKVEGGPHKLSGLVPHHLLTEFDALENPSDRVKLVYASYGLAMFYAQCLEAGLINMAVMEARATGRICFLMKPINLNFDFPKRRWEACLDEFAKS